MKFRGYIDVFKGKAQLKAFSYKRVSTEEQAKGNSLISQDDLNESWAKRNNVTIVKTFTDSASGKSFARTQWRRLEDAIKRNKENIDLVIVYSRDRFARNTIEGIKVLEKFLDRYGVLIVSATQDHFIDLSDPTFWKRWRDDLSDAEFQSDATSERTRRCNHYAQLQGRWTNNAPFGYVNKRDEHGKAYIEPDESQAIVTRQIFSDFMSGNYTFKSILKRANDKGFPRAGHSAIKRILQNRAYLGEVYVTPFKDHQGGWTKAAHEPIVDRDVFLLANSMLSGGDKALRPSIGRQVYREELPLRGIIHCGVCGELLTGGMSKGRHGGHYPQYRCDRHLGSGRNYSGKKAHRQFEQILQELSFTSKAADFFELELEKQFTSQVKQSTGRRDELEKEVLQVKSKLTSLEEKYILDKITQETYDRWFGTWRNELDSRNIELNNISIDTESLYKSFQKAKPALINIYELYDNLGGVQDKQELILAIFPQKLTRLQASYRTPKISDLFLRNSLNISILQVQNNNGNTTKQGDIPIRAPSGNGIEPELRTFISLLKRVG